MKDLYRHDWDKITLTPLGRQGSTTGLSSLAKRMLPPIKTLETKGVLSDYENYGAMVADGVFEYNTPKGVKFTTLDELQELQTQALEELAHKGYINLTSTK